MKQLIILFTVMFFACNAKAQDKLITQKGDVKIVYNVEVGTSNIFYKLENKENAALQQIHKKDVVMIIHADGSKELFTGDTTSTPKAETPQNVQPTASISQIDRHPVVVKDENFVPVMFVDEKEKAKNKKAKTAYMLYQLKNGSYLSDDNLTVECSIITDNFYMIPMGFNFSVLLRNKTNKTIYIDLGNIFIMRGGEATAYYIPSATSTGTETSKGGSVNLGSVGSAIGVGGAAGTLLNGVNVGGSSSKSSTTTIYTQRIVAIPPMSQKTLESQSLFPVGSDARYNEFIKTEETHTITGKPTGVSFTKLNSSIALKVGESRLFNENNSPIQFAAFIAYSFNENCSETASLQANYYVKQIIGIPWSSWSATTMEKKAENLLSADWKSRFFSFLLVK